MGPLAKITSETDNAVKEMLGLVLKTGANCHAWDLKLGVLTNTSSKLQVLQVQEQENQLEDSQLIAMSCRPFFPAATIQQGSSSSSIKLIEFIKLIGTCRHTSKGGMLPGEINITSGSSKTAQLNHVEAWLIRYRATHSCPSWNLFQAQSAWFA